MSRVPLVAANFKMNFLRSDVRAWAGAFVAAGDLGRVEVCAATGHTLLETARDAFAALPVAVYGQDLSQHPHGAFTGDVSAAQLADAGATGTLVGHSERRQLHGETDALVRAKVDAALAHGLKVIVCVGETLEQREAGRTDEVVVGQLVAAIGGLPSLDRVVVAYEPVWAIGTGRTATPEDADAVHRELRARAVSLHGAGADGLRILYGGSVKPDNAEQLLSMPDIDGALVGGASLDAAAFLRIVRAAALPQPG